MKTVSIFLLALLSTSAVCSQTQRKEYAEADDMFAGNRYSVVWPYYLDLLKTDSLNADLNFKMGVCYLNSRSQKEKAVHCFKKAIASGNGTSLPDTIYKLLADACYLAGLYDEAKINYEKYAKILLNAKQSNRFAKDEVLRKIEMCEMGKEIEELKKLTASLMGNQIQKAENISDSLAVNYIARSASGPAQTSFTFKRPLQTDTALSRDNDHFKDTTFEKGYLATVSKSTDTSRHIMETTVATSADGQIILIYRDDKGEGNLYAARLNGNEWMAPEKLSKTINDKGWEPNEFISVDGKALYFSCNRPGGFGGKDIYKSIRQTNGEWGKAMNMGPAVNTEYDEEAPFMHPDGVTFYFSSNRYRTNGFFDNFSTSWSDSGWSAPKNVGYPAKQQDNSASKKVNSKKQDEKENYRVTFMDRKVPVTMIKGKVADWNGKTPSNVKITVTDNETGEVSGIYYSNNETGKYMLILPPDKNNNITYEAEGYMYHSENMDTSKETSFYKAHNSIVLSPFAPGSSEALNNVFFDDKTLLDQASHVELNRICELLRRDPKMTIEVSISINKEGVKDEIKLADDKLGGIRDYILENGIAKERVETKVYQKTKRSRKSKRKKKSENNTENISGKIMLKILKMDT